MEYVEFKRHVKKAGLTIGEFASLLGVRRSSVSNYASEPAVPRSYAVTAVLLGEMADHGLDFREVLTRFGMPIYKDADSTNVRHLDAYRHTRAPKDSSK